MKRKFLMTIGILLISILLKSLLFSCEFKNTKEDKVTPDKETTSVEYLNSQPYFDTVYYELVNSFGEPHKAKDLFMVLSIDSLSNKRQLVRVQDSENKFDFISSSFDSLKMELSLETKNYENFLIKFHRDTSKFNYLNHSYNSRLMPSYSVLENVLYLDDIKDSIYVFNNVTKTLSLETNEFELNIWSTSYAIYPYIPIVINFPHLQYYLQIDTSKNDLFKNLLIELENHPHYQNLLDQIASDRAETKKILDEMEIERDLNNMRE